MLTDNLRLELQTTVSAVNRWAEKQCDTLDYHKLTYDKTVEEFDSTIAALSKTNDDLENMRPAQDQIKSMQMNEKALLNQDIEQLANKNNNLENNLKTLEAEELSLKKQLAEKTREFELAKIEAVKAQNDRRYGLSKFVKALGLRFEKAKQESIKFIFNNLKQNQPEFECYFIIRVDEDDVYQLMDISPKLDTYTIHTHQNDTTTFIEMLNNDNDISKFTANMRKLFQNNV